MGNGLLAILGLILGLALFIFLFVKLVKATKKGYLGDETPKVTLKEHKAILVILVLQGLLLIMTNYGFALWGSWDLSANDHRLLVFGSFLFGAAVDLFLVGFILHFYRTNLDKTQAKRLWIKFLFSIPVLIIGFVCITESAAFHLDYPLVNGFSFTSGWIKPGQSGVRFYGILIVTGAVLVYFLCDHYFYKKFKKHGIIDTLLLVAFPAGIIGARLWSCLILEPARYLKDPIAILRIWEGGLAIQGGALFGIIFGVGFMLIFRRYVNIRWAMDVIVPTILIAQAIGRFGNFFNVEVHGNAVSMTSLWFVPSVFKFNYQYSSIAGASSLVGTDQCYLPLFFIEGVTNICGYLLIRLFGYKILRKKVSLGDQAMMYVFWYGLTRFLLEPLRYGYKSGDGFGYSQSFITAIIMMGVGILGIILFHLYDYIRKVKGLSPRKLDTI